MYTHAWAGNPEYRPCKRRKWANKGRLVFVRGFPIGPHRADIERFFTFQQVASCILIWPEQIETGSQNYLCHLVFQQAADASAALQVLDNVRFHGRVLHAEALRDDVSINSGTAFLSLTGAKQTAHSLPHRQPQYPVSATTVQPTGTPDTLGSTVTPYQQSVPEETEAAHAAVFNFTSIPQIWQDPWVYNSEKPTAHVEAVYQSLRGWNSTIEEVFPKTRYILAQPDETGTGSKLHARQYPASHAVTGDSPSAPGVNDDCQGVYITVVRTDPANGTTVSKTIPLDDVEKWKSEGWNIWYYPSRPCNKDKNGVDPRPISAPEDIIHQDKPHRDTMKLFHTGSPYDDLSFASRGDNKAVWAPGELMGQDAQSSASLSFAPARMLPSPGSITDSRTITHDAFVEKHRCPYGVGMGWGDYDMYTDWQNAGRQITKDMIPKKNWNLGREPVTLWCPENPTSTIYLPPMNESSQNAAGGEEEIETATKRSLWDRFNPSEAHMSRFQPIGYGLSGQVPLGGREGRGGRGSGFISRFG